MTRSHAENYIIISAVSRKNLYGGRLKHRGLDEKIRQALNGIISAKKRSRGWWYSSFLYVIHN